MYSISFCIPTYNRCQLLRETLEIILSQSVDVEIVVSDNCSLDDTQKYMEALCQRYPQIHYYRWAQSVECGQNLLHTIELATGDYCWLMTDDDCLESGAIDHVMGILQNYPGITGVSVNVEGYDRFLKEKKKIRYSHSLQTSQLFQEQKKCFRELGAWFGYWSAHIIDRCKWNRAKLQGGHESFLGYHHLYLFLSMLKKDPYWYFTAQKCVAYRADNESFSVDHGAYRRYEIDVISYKRIGEEFFGRKNNIVEHIQNVVLHKYHFWQLVTLKCHCVSFKTLYKIFVLSFRYYHLFPGFWCKLIPVIITPAPIILGVRWIYRRWFKH
jgi:abequosyltransferase